MTTPHDTDAELDRAIGCHGVLAILAARLRATEARLDRIDAAAASATSTPPTPVANAPAPRYNGARPDCRDCIWQDTVKLPCHRHRDPPTKEDTNSPWRNDDGICVQCGNPVEEMRRCYVATPVPETAKPKARGKKP